MWDVGRRESDVKLLIIDDNNDITDAVRFFCETKNIDCEIANNASEGLTAIHNGTFNLILLDIAMPEVSGFEVIKSLKNEGLLEKLNIVIFTASSDHNLFEEIRKMGLKEILRKPCSVEDLTELIKRYNFVV